ncbi:Na+/H+ antiporter subunit E [Legionella impletisoli]|uniref:Sodium:proton antiporter n=1 Tax=Legionella impletisoli TaxID=343510 RepID=A0A917JWS2_9GAMM|nr:Na+/H+ antiporter subunit E [Legionella impletisoli]GGI90355.1 sodium:proton antiporter [Legionella impletisoli]
MKSFQLIYRIGYFILFSFFVLYEIVLANLRVAYAVIMPSFRGKPALIDYPLSCTNDIQITALANIISLTPGTLTLEISKDKKHMLLHVMFFSDKQRLINQLHTKFERPIMEIWP